MERGIRGRIPFVTAAAIVVNIAVWVFLEVIGDTRDSWFMVQHGASYAPLIIGNGEWQRLFTAMFLHFDANHLIHNMFMLAMLGYRLEHAMGSIRFCILYVLSGLCGSLLSLYGEIRIPGGQPSVSAGASGAVFGVMGGLLAWAVWHKGKVEDLTLKGLCILAALSMYYGFSAAGVDNLGHIGGFLGGILFGSLSALFRRRPGNRAEDDLF